MWLGIGKEVVDEDERRRRREWLANYNLTFTSSRSLKGGKERCE